LLQIHIWVGNKLNPPFILNTKHNVIPLGVLGAENDHLSPPALLKQFGEALAAKSEVGKSNASFLMEPSN
jgi:hypothetical protein